MSKVPSAKIISGCRAKKAVGSLRVWRELHTRQLIQPVSLGNAKGSAYYYLVDDIEQALVRLRDSHSSIGEVHNAN